MKICFALRPNCHVPCPHIIGRALRLWWQCKEWGWSLLGEREGHTDPASFSELLFLFVLNFVKNSFRLQRRMLVILLNHSIIETTEIHRSTSSTNHHWKNPDIFNYYLIFVMGTIF